MAYTIISQNNSTTTLSDGVNTITVPSRVNLTSGNFTIVEVNNNMATLEDGDGNVYRDIPCVATLAGEGGGGGSGLPDQTGHSGEFLTTDGTDASWAAVDALPDQTGHRGEFLTTDGTDASWSDKPLVNKALGTNALAILGSSGQYDHYNVVLGYGASAQGSRQVVSGYNASTNKDSAIALGANAHATALYACQICTAGVVGATNNDANTYKFANNNGNFEIMSANGTIPTARLTKVNSTITLTAAGWSSNTQTVTVTGVTSTSVVLVAPDPSDTADYVAAGILCTSQTTDSLTFTATTTPTNDIDVNIVCL